MRASIVVASLPVLVGLGCSGGQSRSGAGGAGASLGGASGAGGRGGAGAKQPVAMAVLRPNVKVLDAAQVTIAPAVPSTWVVTGPFAAQVGDVLLMDTTAAKVVSVSAAAGVTTLSVTPAGVAEVFSKLDVDQNIDLMNAELTPGSDTAASTARALAASRPNELLPRANGDATTIGVTLNGELNVPINRPPVTGSLTMGLTGTISAGYDDVHGASGAIAATGYFHGSATAAFMETVTISPETTIGTIRIPIPVSVFDAALKYLGVRLAAIYVPVSVGIETTTGYGISLTADGSASTTLTASYDDTNGFATSPPTVTGAASLTGSLPGAGPSAAIQDTLSFGVYVRAKPQLLILNEVASIGGDIKIGRYVKGTLTGFLQPPSYCLNAQGELDAEVFAFFKGTGITEKDSPTWSPPGIAVGAPFSAGNCSMGGAGGAGGASSAGGNSGRGGASGALAGASGAAGHGGAGNGGSGVPQVMRPDQTGAPPVQYGAIALGDPHLRTFDGVRYDEQPVGETVLVRSATGDFEVQERTKPWNNSTRVAVIVGAAARVGAGRFSVYLDGSVRLDDTLITVPQGQTPLSSGVVLFRAGSTFVLVWPDGAQVRINLYSSFMGVEVHLPDARRGQVLGLLGNFDDEPTGDLTVRNGPVLPDAPNLAYFYGVFIESWRIAQADSLFYYGPGETTETFTDRSFPPMPARAVDLDPTSRTSAAAVCAAAGVSAEWMDACLVDVGFTADPSFAGALTNLLPPAGSVDVHPGSGTGADGSTLLGNDGDDSGTITGTLAPGATRTYALTVQKGQFLAARLADTSRNTFVPRLALLDPTGAVASQNYGADVAAVSATASMTGTYSLVVSDASGKSDVTGNYTLYFLVAPGANEGGALAPGGVVSQTIDLGDLDSYTFTAAAGQGVQLRVADVAGGAFTPAVAVYDPTGALVNSSYAAEVAGVNLTTSMAGTYTVLVYDYSSGLASTGAYNLYFAMAPGANEGGALPPGGILQGAIDKGDLDSYTFAAAAGQGVQLRAVDLVGGAFTPAIAVYAPTGALVNSTYAADVAGLNFTTTMAGTYTVLVYDYSSGLASSGAYNLYFAIAPGASEGGPLPAGGMVSEVIDKGDLDSYTFPAAAGQGVQLRAVDLVGGAFTPAIAVYDPSGALVNSTYAADVAGLNFTTAMAGTYTVLVYDYSSGLASSGAYNLYFAIAPGANEGGVLSPDAMVAGVIDKGDLDSYTFSAAAGQGVQVRAADVAGTAFTPAIAIYAPNGALVNSTYAADVAGLNFVTSMAGTYTVLVYDYSSGLASGGAYNLYLALAPGANEGATLTPGTPVMGAIDEGDLDSYTLAAATGQVMKIQVTDLAAGPFTPAIALYGPTGALVSSTYAADAATLSFTASSAGTYTVLVYDYSSGLASTGTYSVLVTAM